MEKIPLKNFQSQKFPAKKIHAQKISNVKNFERKKCKNWKSQNGTIFKFRGDIAISGSREKSRAGKFPATKIFTAKNFRLKKIWARKKPNEKSLNRKNFRLKKISGPKKIRPWNFQSLKFSGTKKFRPRKKLSQQFQRSRWFIPSFPVETIRQPESEASYWVDAIFGSQTVALIRASPFHRVRCRFSGLIRKKAGLIHIKSPLHRRKIKRPNRP